MVKPGDLRLHNEGGNWHTISRYPYWTKRATGMPNIPISHISEGPNPYFLDRYSEFAQEILSNTIAKSLLQFSQTVGSQGKGLNLRGWRELKERSWKLAEVKHSHWMGPGLSGPQTLSHKFIVKGQSRGNESQEAKVLSLYSIPSSLKWFALFPDFAKQTTFRAHVVFAVFISNFPWIFQFSGLIWWCQTNTMKPNRHV